MSMQRKMSQLRRKPPPVSTPDPPTIQLPTPNDSLRSSSSALSSQSHHNDTNELPNNNVIGLPNNYADDLDVNESTAEYKSETVKAFRNSNPNLQPLSPKEKETVSRSNRRSVDPSDPPKGPLVSSPTSSSTTSNVTSSRRSQIIAPSSTATASSTKISQSFWKYHILEIGNDLYLTTNPDERFLYCRHASGIHVQVLFPQIGSNQRDITGKSGFRLVFEDESTGSVFMSVTKSQDGREFSLSGTASMMERDGSIITVEDESKTSRLLVNASKTQIKELKNKYYDPTPSSVTPIRYHTTQENGGKSWNIGSIPQYKLGTSKLRNKRYIYTTDPTNNRKIYACFRPHESRTKKKVIKKLNSKMVNSSPFRNNAGVGDADDRVVFDQGEVKYFTPGDGVFQKDPPDDAPNSDKLGWLTIFDDAQVLREMGNWEQIVGFTLAVGFSRVLDEKYI